MRKARHKYTIPDLTEYTDSEGRKWIQTSIDDLFSIQELNDIIENVEKKDDGKEIVLARIDFQKVNKEYYEAVIELQKKLQKQNALLKRVVTESREVIDRKNRKLRELIDYIKQMHELMPGIQTGEVTLTAAPSVESEETGEPSAASSPSVLQKAQGRIIISDAEYEDVAEEVLLQGPENV